jgi:hypothetical protein
VRTCFYLPLIGLCLALAGCGTQVTAPSLMPRAVEKQPIDMPVSEAIEPEGAADAALTARLTEQVAAAEAADRRFEAELRKAEAAVVAASGQAQGGEAWIQAQQAITALESPRVAVRDAAAAIDAVRLEPANAAPGNRSAIDLAARRIGGIEQREAAAIAALAGKLG